MAPEKKAKNYSGISELLKQQGKTQTWLAEKTGIPRANINRYATAAIKKPNMVALEAMAKALKVNVEDMIEFEETTEEEVHSPRHYTLHAEPLVIGGEQKMKVYSRLAPPRFLESLAANEMLSCVDAMMVDTQSFSFIDRPSFLMSPEAFAVRVPDNEMEPFYKKNDVLFVDPDLNWTVGDVVAIKFFHENQEMFIIRRIGAGSSDTELSLLTVAEEVEEAGTIFEDAAERTEEDRKRELTQLHGTHLEIYPVAGCHYSR